MEHNYTKRSITEWNEIQLTSSFFLQKDDLQRTELRSNMQNLAKSCGGITKALQAFCLMRTGKPTVYDYNSLVNCYLKSENVCLHDLSDLYTEMNTLGLYPNATTFNTLGHAWFDNALSLKLTNDHPSMRIIHRKVSLILGQWVSKVNINSNG